MFCIRTVVNDTKHTSEEFHNHPTARPPYHSVTHLSNRQDVKHGLKEDPDNYKAEGMGIKEGFNRRQWRRKVGQAGVVQVHLKYQEKHPGREKEQPEVRS